MQIVTSTDPHWNIGVGGWWDALGIGLALLSLGLLAGCEVGPNYGTPQQHMPAHWVSPPTTQASITVQEKVDVAKWWTTFNDPELDSLIHRALGENLDIQLATQRIRQSRAALGASTSGLFPLIGANGSYNHSFNGRSGSAFTNSSGQVITTSGQTSYFWQAGFDSTWELDFFGGTRRGIEAARATYEASVEDRRDVMVTLLGEVATTYMQLRGYQQQIAIAEENLAGQQKSLEVTRNKQLYGAGKGLDIANAEAQVATTRSQIPAYESLEQQQIYALGVLLGQEPATLLVELSPEGKIPISPPVVPVGLPSDLLRRRPDIRRAERQLAAATASVGVATAQLFPQFSLDGSLSTGGSRFGNLGNWGTRIWSFGPAFNWPIFDAGAIWNNIEVTNALQAQALITYRQAVLNALLDVENSLTAYAQEQQRRQSLADAVAAYQRAVSLASQNFQNGFSDFLTLFVAQQSLYGAQSSLVASNQAVATDLVAIYKALGGGWEESDPATTQPSDPAAKPPFAAERLTIPATQPAAPTTQPS